MRVAVIVRPKHQIPPEEMSMVFQAFSAWREQHRAKMEVFEFFLGGGGFGIFDVDDAEELHRIMLQNPIFFIGDTDVTPIVDGDTALRQWGEAIEQMQQMGAPA